MIEAVVQIVVALVMCGACYLAGRYDERGREARRQRHERQDQLRREAKRLWG